MKLHKSITYMSFLVFGIIAGYVTRDLILKKSGTTEISYVERHEGQTKHINPLLACDDAEDRLRDPQLSSFKDKLEAYLQSRINIRGATNASVYFRELNDGHWFSIGDSEKFIPASLRKVPLMIALLKQAETDKILLDRLVKYNLSNDYNLNQNIKPAQTLVPSQKYTIRELIYRMIAYSDNNAFTFLTKIVDPLQFDKTYADLRLLNPRAVKDDDFLSIQTYESFFRILYNASYLSKEASDWALDTLSKSEFRTGLVAGVPPSITVAHKFGEKSDAASGTVQLHDCGIVYYPQHPYLLCVMSRGVNFEFLDNVIADISRLTYAEVDSQHRNH